MQGSPRKPGWIGVGFRVLVVTFLLTLLSFAVSLLLAIVGVMVSAKLRGVAPDAAYAYRHVALPVAMIVAPMVLMVATVFEVKRYRQMGVLAGIARSSQS